MDTYKVMGIGRDEVFCYLGDGFEVYAINPINDNFVNLKFETVDTVLAMLDKGCYACFVVNCVERG